MIFWPWELLFDPKTARKLLGQPKKPKNSSIGTKVYVLSLIHMFLEWIPGGSIFHFSKILIFGVFLGPKNGSKPSGKAWMIYFLCLFIIRVNPCGCFFIWLKMLYLVVSFTFKRFTVLKGFGILLWILLWYNDSIPFFFLINRLWRCCF